MKFSFLWLVPFLCFFSGYYLIFRLTAVSSVETPRVVGLLLQDALKMLAASQLQAQIIAEKEEADLPDGLVLDQMPHPQQQIKISQPLYLTIARKPPHARAPNLLGMTKETAVQEAQSQAIRIKFHELESNYPVGYCFGHYPVAGEPLEDEALDVYVSAGITTTRIFPSCKDMPVQDVESFCKKLGMTVHIFHAHKIAEDHECACTVREQKPLAGTLIDLKKPLIVQLIVEQP